MKHKQVSAYRDKNNDILYYKSQQLCFLFDTDYVHIRITRYFFKTTLQ